MKRDAYQNFSVSEDFKLFLTKFEQIVMAKKLSESSYLIYVFEENPNGLDEFFSIGGVDTKINNPTCKEIWETYKSGQNFFYASDEHPKRIQVEK